MAEDIAMPDADAVREQTLMYGGERDLDERYPYRPSNLHKTLPFHTLFNELFDPLMDTNKNRRPTGPRRRAGPSGHSSLNPHEAKRNIIQRYIEQWRKEVGNDFYPAMRLIIPEKDRDRAMYGLKEKAIAKILIQVTKINKDSDDAKQMINWKLPGQLHKGAVSTAGDFAGRCYEVLSKRPMRSAVGNMTVAEVNNTLDRLSQVGAEKEQVKIFERFYRRMNPDEMTWLIRIILRQMKIGATEKTILDIWHPDAEALFNISSNLRRVCWDLYDQRTRLDGEERGINLMQCFQPQLAAFQPKVGSFDKIVAKLKPTEDDNTFWIEEKLDGERMQLHMMEDPSAPGGRVFGFWSRKAKDYAYLYGKHLSGTNSGALTRFIKDAFHKSVRNIILDGEMITWDMDTDHIVGFGTLKTAALSEKENTTGANTGQRPLFRVFDCLYLNDALLTNYTLRDRRAALQSAVKGIHRRLEVHSYIEAHAPSQVEPELRRVVENASEGLVLKNPRSAYKLNERNDDWVKVKPEYMSEFGEMIDCVVIGGYFGSGHRGGAHSSYLCGLLVNKKAKQGDNDYGKCISFFKVGGGFSREDYSSIRARTEGKWNDWDHRRPPGIIELGGHDANRQHERPDQWIHPSDSMVIECKAASVEASDKFRLNLTLRFPRFKALRTDKSWNQALSIDEFYEVKHAAETEHADKQKEFKIEQSRRKRARMTKRPLVVAGSETTTHYAGPNSKLFEGLDFYIMTDQIQPSKKSKADLEALTKAHGAKIIQRNTSDPNLIAIAEKRLVKVSSLEKRGDTNIIKPVWIHDCIRQNEIDADASPYLLPYEANRHLFFLLDSHQMSVEANIDGNGDPYARDIFDVDEMRNILAGVPQKLELDMFDSGQLIDQLEGHGHDMMSLKSYMFSNTMFAFAQTDDRAWMLRAQLARNYVKFAAGTIVEDDEREGITHIVVPNRDYQGNGDSGSSRLARRVGIEWVERCWEEGTRVDEQRFQWG